MKYNRHLDGLRAGAVLLVIGMHYDLLLPFGWIGVQAFFVLSGYLISAIILEAKESRPDPALRTFLPVFFARRCLRLFPLYYGYLALVALIYFFSGQPHQLAAEWPALLSYTLNFHWLFKSYAASPYFAHLWSLCVECQFYLLWPFVLWFLPSRFLPLTLWLTLPIAATARFATYGLCEKIECFNAFRSHDFGVLAVYALPLSHLDAFSLGALICRPSQRSFLASRTAMVPLLVLSIAISVMMINFAGPYYSKWSLGWPNGLPSGWQWLWGYTLLDLLLACLVAWLVCHSQKHIRGWDSRFWVHIGRISYGIYVFHFRIVDRVETVLLPRLHFYGGDVVGWMVCSLLSIAAAHLSYRYYEQRFLVRKPGYRVKSSAVPAIKLGHGETL